MRELNISELDIISGGLTWKGRSQSENVGVTQYINDEPVWIDYDLKGFCEPVYTLEQYEDGDNYSK